MGICSQGRCLPALSFEFPNAGSEDCLFLLRIADANMPTDEQAWDPKLGCLAYKNGKCLMLPDSLYVSLGHANMPVKSTQALADGRPVRRGAANPANPTVSISPLDA